MSANKIKLTEYLGYIFCFIVFILLFKETLDYGRTFDDDSLVNKVIKAPGDAKLISSLLYAKFHFYPVYFLSHELDNFSTFILNYININVFNSQVAKFTNFFLHITNSFLIYYLLKIIFLTKDDFKKNLIIYISTFIFLFHPITSQTIFNITTRNESLALFFGLLTFIYCIRHFNNKKNINYLYITLLFFFSLSSKLTTVFLVGLIPLTIFILNYHKINYVINLKKNYNILVTLIIPFIIYYYLRSNFTEKNNLIFYSNFGDLIFYFFTTIKFYLIGLFFPYEHIYIYAGNYDLTKSIIIFIIFFVFLILSILNFFIKKDPYLLIASLWICASLSLPVLFGLIESGFPLISNLAERYQYSSVVSLPIIFSWILINYLNTKKIYSNTILVCFLIGIIFFSVLILKDRSKVYVNNSTFMSQMDESSPKNIFRYAFTHEMKIAAMEKDESKYLYNLYQLYSLNPNFDETILEFIRFFILIENNTGEKYFEEIYLNRFNDSPNQIYKLARFNSVYKKYDKAKKNILNIFDKYQELEDSKSLINKYIIFKEPSRDDLHFELGKIEFNLGNYKLALYNFKEATIINPYHATALYNAAITLKKLGLVEEAANAYKEAIRINPFLRETSKNLIENTR